MARSVRFFSGFPWRFILTLLDGEIVTSLERLAINRSLLFKLNEPATHSGQVPSNDPRVNITDVEPYLDAPHLSFNDRLIYGFRREQTDPDLWVCRFGGLVMQIEDSAREDQPYSTYTAYDPWQYWFSRKLWDGTGSVGADGLSYNAPGNEIVADLLTNAEQDGSLLVVWDTNDWDTTATVDITFQQGTSLGDALRQLCATNSLNIILTPLYDPAQPGVCATVFVYTQAGTTQDDEPFSWGVGRQIVGISSLLDGGQMSNEIRFHNGQGGPLVTPAEDQSSQGRYGVYSSERFFPGQVQTATVEEFAEFSLSLRKQGKRTVTISPNPLLSPKPFLDYNLGDRVPVYATTDLRQALPWSTDETVYQRIYGIPIRLGDDGVETVERLIASPDGFS